ncbi:MAG: hypothetical protein V4677_11135 [Bacteroidota bacterium]
MGISSYFFGTKAFLRQERKDIVTQVQKVVRSYQTIRNLSNEEKNTFFKVSKAHIKKVATIETRFRNLYSHVLFYCLLPIGIFIQFILPFIINRCYNSFNYSGWQLLWYFLLVLLFFGIVASIILIPVSLFKLKEYNKKKIGVLQGTYFFITTSCLLYYSYNRLYLDGSLLYKSFFVGMFNAVMYLIGVGFIIICLLEPLNILYKGRKLNRIPESVIIIGIIRLLRESERKILYNNNERKLMFLFKVEKYALIIERQMPLLIDSFDKRSNMWAKKTYSEIAFSFRDLKKEIIINGKLSSYNLNKLLSDYFKKIIVNDWNSLDRKELPKELIIKQAKNKMFFYIKTFFVAIFPISTLGIIRHYEILNIDTIHFQYVMIVTILWFIVNILVILDPSIREKISAIKEVATMRGPQD